MNRSVEGVNLKRREGMVELERGESYKIYPEIRLVSVTLNFLVAWYQICVIC